MKRVTAAFVAVLMANIGHSSLYDSFDGDRLSPHWSFNSEDQNELVYEVANSRLNVLGFEPTYGAVRMETPFLDLPQGDYEASLAFDSDTVSDRVFGWALTEQFAFNYRRRAGVAEFWVNLQGPSPHLLPAVQAGRTVLTVRRTNEEFNVFVNGSLVVTEAGRSSDSGYIGLYFAPVATGEAWTPMRFDYVYVVVPEPSTLFVFLGLLTLVHRKKVRSITGKP